MFLIYFFKRFIYVLVVVCLHYCTWAFSVCSKQGRFVIDLHWHLIAVAFLVVEQGF